MSAHSSSATTGLILVHGIGNHERGDLLRGVVNAITSRPFAGRDRVEGFQIDGSTARVEFVDVRDGRRVVAEEAFWGDLVPTSSLRRVLQWLAAVGPFVAMGHVLRGVKRLGSREYPMTAVRWLRVGSGALGRWLLFIVAFPMWFGPVLLALLAGRLIPFKGAEVVTRLQRVLSTVIGDSYVFLTDDFTRVRVLEVVSGAVESALLEHDRVVVVAHSQGAAIAVDAVGDLTPEDRLHLVTLGSGLRLLQELRSLLDARPGSVVYGLTVTLVLPLAAVTVWVAVGWQGAIAVGILALGYAAYFARQYRHRFELMPHASRAFVAETAGRIGSWVDVHASKDLVPDGALTPARDIPGFTSRAVTNTHTITLDHTTYLANPDVVVLIRRALGMSVATDRTMEPEVRRLLVESTALVAKALVLLAAGVTAVSVVAGDFGPRWLGVAVGIVLLAAWHVGEAAWRLSAATSPEQPPRGTTAVGRLVDRMWHHREPLLEGQWAHAAVVTLVTAALIVWPTGASAADRGLGLVLLIAVGVVVYVVARRLLRSVARWWIGSRASVPSEGRRAS